MKPIILTLIGLLLLTVCILAYEIGIMQTQLNALAGTVQGLEREVEP